jgi:uncharacterized MnhB-related membrane protein
MAIVKGILLLLLIVCAISVSRTKRLLTAVIIFMSYSLLMSVVWLLLESPDLAITEAAVGAGVDTILMFVALKKIHRTESDAEAACKAEEKTAAEGQADASGKEENRENQ